MGEGGSLCRSVGWSESRCENVRNSVHFSGAQLPPADTSPIFTPMLRACGPETPAALRPAPLLAAGVPQQAPSASLGDALGPPRQGPVGTLTQPVTSQPGGFVCPELSYSASRGYGWQLDLPTAVSPSLHCDLFLVAVGDSPTWNNVNCGVNTKIDAGRRPG